jgi:hypothetical protein
MKSVAIVVFVWWPVGRFNKGNPSKQWQTGGECFKSPLTKCQRRTFVYYFSFLSHNKYGFFA